MDEFVDYERSLYYNYPEYAQNEPSDYYLVANSEYYNQESKKYATNELLNYDLSQKSPSGSYVDSEMPGTSIVGEQDFLKQGKSAKSK